MIEVLKQMVEALEWCHGGEPIGTADAIKAGKQAIKELESQEPDVVMHWHSHTWTIINPPPKNSSDVNLYYASPQRTEQNFCPRCGKRTNDIHTCTPPQIKTTDKFESAKVEDYNRGWNDCLFASGIVKQSQRTWIGLTDDDEIPWDGVDAKSFAQAIEAKLKERNT